MHATWPFHLNNSMCLRCFNKIRLKGRKVYVSPYVISQSFCLPLCSSVNMITAIHYRSEAWSSTCFGTRCTAVSVSYSFFVSLLTIFTPLLHTYLTPPHDTGDSLDKTARYRTPCTKLGLYF